MQRLCFAAVVGLAACGGGGTPSEASPAKAEVATPLDAQAAAFVASAVKDSVHRVEWGSVIRANALAVVQVAASMDGAQLHAAANVDDPIGAMVATLASVDASEEASKESKAFTTAWTGAEGCKAKPAADAPLATLPAAVQKTLPADYVKTLEAVRAGSAFDVTCDGVEAMVVLDAQGKVIAMDRLRKRGDGLSLELTEEERFVGYMNEPE